MIYSFVSKVLLHFLLEYLHMLLALDYFLRIYSDIDSEFDKSKTMKNEFFNLNLIRLEVIYSIGLCYKKLHEYNSAEYFLNKAFSSIHELKTGYSVNSKCEPLPRINIHLENISEDKQKAVSSKFLKITDDYLDVLCNLHRYTIAKQAVRLLLPIQSMPQSQYMLKCTLQRLSILEGIKKAHINTSIQIEPFDIEIKDCSDIFTGLNCYHNLVRCTLCNPDHVITQSILKPNSETMMAYKLFKKYVDYSLNKSSDNENPIIIWNFDDLLFSINEYFKDAKYTYLREFIEDITSQIKSVFDIILSHKRTL